MQHSFKPGDMARVVKKVEEAEGWEERWVDFMDTTIGGEYTVLEVGRFSGICLHIPRDCGCKTDFWFPVESLEKVG